MSADSEDLEVDVQHLHLRTNALFKCDVTPPLTLVWHLCLFSGLQRSAEAESRAEAEDEAKFSFHKHKCNF